MALSSRWSPKATRRHDTLPIRSSKYLNQTTWCRRFSRWCRCSCLPITSASEEVATSISRGTWRSRLPSNDLLALPLCRRWRDTRLQDIHDDSSFGLGEDKPEDRRRGRGNIDHARYLNPCPGADTIAVKKERCSHLCSARQVSVSAVIVSAITHLLPGGALSKRQS